MPKHAKKKHKGNEIASSEKTNHGLKASTSFHRPLTGAAKKKEITDGLTSEIKQLQDSLSTFFTPVSGSRLRNSNRASSRPVIESSEEVSHIVKPSTSSFKPEISYENVCKYPAKILRLFKLKKFMTMNNLTSYQNHSITDVNKQLEDLTGIELPSVTASRSPEPGSSRMSDDGEGSTRIDGKVHYGYFSNHLLSEGISDDEPLLVDPKYCYKGFQFKSSSNPDLLPGTCDPKAIIATFKAMEATHRSKNDFEEYSVSSCSEWEQEPISTTNEKRSRRYVRVLDGLTKAERRENRQFELEFAELLEALQEAQIAYCSPYESGKKKFEYVPFDDAKWPQQCREAILLRAMERREAKKLKIVKPEKKGKKRGRKPKKVKTVEDLSSDADVEDEAGQVRQRFSEMDLKPLLGMSKLLSSKSIKKEAANRTSMETNGKDSKPSTSTSSFSAPHRISYRFAIRRACRQMILKGKSKHKQHEFLQIKTDGILDKKNCDQDMKENIPTSTVSLDLDQKDVLMKFFDVIARRKAKHSNGVVDSEVQYIYSRSFKMKTLYRSTFPGDSKPKPEIYICDLCLIKFSSKAMFESHERKCQSISPPGQCIYRDEEYNLSIFEVDGALNPDYAMILSAWGKCYIPSKIRTHAVEACKFYVLTKHKHTTKNHFIGYFSKHKYSQTNLSSILVLPCYQGRGYGRFLVDFSFLMSRSQGIPGTPERPLTEAADCLYYQYYVDSFKEAALQYCLELTKNGKDMSKDSFTLQKIELETGICREDLLKVLYTEGIASVGRNDPTNPSKSELFFKITPEELMAHMKTQKAKKTRRWIKTNLLQWKPTKLEESLHLPSTSKLDNVNLSKPPEEPGKKAGRGRPKKIHKQPSVPIKKTPEYDSNKEDDDEDFDLKKGGTRSQTRNLVAAKKESKKAAMQTPVKPHQKAEKKKPGPVPGGAKRGRKPKKEQPKKSKPLGAPKRKIKSSPESSEAEDSYESEEEEPPPKKKASPVKKEIKKKITSPKSKAKTPQPRVISSDSEVSDASEPKPKTTKLTNQKKTPSTTPKNKKLAKVGETPKGRTPSREHKETPKVKSTPKVPKTADNSSEEEEEEYQQLQINFRGSSVDTSSDSDDQRPILPKPSTIDYHNFGATDVNDHEILSPPSSACRSVKRPSRNRSNSLTRQPKETKNEESYDTAPNLFETGSDMPMNFEPTDHMVYEHPQGEMYPFSNEAVKSVPEKEEMPKLIASKPIEAQQKLETIADEDDDEEDEDAPPMLSPAMQVQPHDSPEEKVDDFVSPVLNNNNNVQPMEIEAELPPPPILQNSSVPQVESVQSHRAPESLQNPASRRSSTEVPQSHSVPNQSIMHNNHQQLSQQPMMAPQQQQWTSDMYNMQHQQQQSHPPVLQEPMSLPQQQQMTPQQPQSMLSDPSSVYSLPAMPPQQQQQQPVPQASMMPPLMPMDYSGSVEAMKPSTSQIPEPKQVKAPRAPSKKKPKKDQQPTPAVNPMLPQRYPTNPYGSQLDFFNQQYMAQMAAQQFPAQNPYSGYPTASYPSSMPNPSNYHQTYPSTFNWPNQPSAAYPGYPLFNPNFAAAAAAPYSKIPGYPNITANTAVAAAAALNPMTAPHFQAPGGAAWPPRAPNPGANPYDYFFPHQ